MNFVSFKETVGPRTDASGMHTVEEDQAQPFAHFALVTTSRFPRRCSPGRSKPQS